MSTKVNIGPLNVMESKKSSLLHIETDANHPDGAGILICSVNKRFEKWASLFATAPCLLSALQGLLQYKGAGTVSGEDDALTFQIGTLAEKLKAAREAIQKAQS